MTTQQTPQGIPFLRIPEDRFSDLPDFPYEPHYVEVDGLRSDLIPGAEGQPHQFFDPGNHFIQDDIGEPLAAAMVSWLASVKG